MIIEFLIEVVFIDLIGGAILKLNNLILRLRGIETRSADEIKLRKLKKRYKYKSVFCRSDYNEIRKGTQGVVLELIDSEVALVELENFGEIVKVPLKIIAIR